MRLGVRFGPFYASTSTSRRRSSGNGCLITLAVILWPVTVLVLLVWVIVLAVKAIVAAEKRRRWRQQQRRVLEEPRTDIEQGLEAKQKPALEAARADLLRGLKAGRDEALAQCLPAGIQRDAIEGWFAEAIAAADEFTHTNSPEAYARFEQATSAIKQWADAPTQQCASCGAPEQLIGHPCISCQRMILATSANE
jgi:hypothetical protein